VAKLKIVLTQVHIDPNTVVSNVFCRHIAQANNVSGLFFVDGQFFCLSVLY